MDIFVSIPVSNSSKSEQTIGLEPIGDYFSLAPGETVRVVYGVERNNQLDIHIELTPDGPVIWSNVTVNEPIRR